MGACVNVFRVPFHSTKIGIQDYLSHNPATMHLKSMLPVAWLDDAWMG